MYQRSEKPCQALWDFPLLNENKTASPIGTIDQIRYSQVNPSRNHACLQGLRHGGLPRRLATGSALPAPPPEATEGESPTLVALSTAIRQPCPLLRRSGTRNRP